LSNCQIEIKIAEPKVAKNRLTLPQMQEHLFGTGYLARLFNLTNLILFDDRQINLIRFVDANPIIFWFDDRQPDYILGCRSSNHYNYD
jgi:hypothetical protein